MYRLFGLCEVSMSEKVNCGTLKFVGYVTGMNEIIVLYGVYEHRIEGKGVMGRSPVMWTNNMDKYWKSRLTRKAMNVLGESAETGNDGEVSLVATPPPD